MASLFASTTKKRKRAEPSSSTTPTTASHDDSKGIEEAALSTRPDASFASLGLSSWILKSCKAVGFRHPTSVQEQCIPAILSGRDVMGCAETGSGKTAAFALPMLHRLSEDPYGIFAVVLTPTRELAIQIAEQYQVLGAPINLRFSIIIGGMSIVNQSLELSRKPHVIIATPGRLRDHLQGPAPPDLSKAKFLVLDEADRLISPGFESDLEKILEAMSPSRQTLLFSATMTSSLEALQALTTASKPLLFDLTRVRSLPSSLTQQYLFMPAQVKVAYLVEVLKKWVIPRSGDRPDTAFVKSAIIFVGSCKRCQEVHEVLIELGLSSVCLHSALSQHRRLAALGKFKSSLAAILVSTDVASRGLDIPDVDLVINLDMPRVASDYVHRVGRTARAGRRGRALSLVTQYDVDLVHAVEDYTSTKLELCPDVVEEDILKQLNPVAKATRAARQRLMEVGFDEMMEERDARRKKNKMEQRKRRKRKQEKAAGQTEEGA